MKIYLKALFFLAALSTTTSVLSQSHFEKTKQRAETGDVQSQYTVGMMYLDGRGTDQNIQEAAKWLLLSAEQGFANAQYDIGFMYLNGTGFEQNVQMAVSWFSLAAEQGFTNGLYDLGIMYYNGHIVAQDYEHAMKWFLLAAGQGDTSAQRILGYMYSTGTGVTQNDHEAAKWFQLATEQGGVNAQTAISQFESSIISGEYLNQGTLRVLPQEPISQTRSASQIDHLRAKCISFGFQPSTDALAECVQREHQLLNSDRIIQSSDATAEAEVEAIERRRKSDINFCRAAMFSRPTRTGNFFESLENANKCNANPRAHLNQTAPNYRCRADFTGTLTCEAY